MSPAITSVIPQVVTVFGGQQTARTLHFFLANFLVLFLLGHVTMVILGGFRSRMRAMISGRPERLAKAGFMSDILSPAADSSPAGLPQPPEFPGLAVAARICVALRAYPARQRRHLGSGRDAHLHTRPSGFSCRITRSPANSTPAKSPGWCRSVAILR